MEPLVTLSNSSFNFNSRECKFWSCKKNVGIVCKTVEIKYTGTLWISFTYIKKNRGPKTEPCGTPHRIWFESESIVHAETNIYIYVKKNSFVCNVPDTVVFQFFKQDVMVNSIKGLLQVGLLAQLVRALHRYRRRQGFESRTSLIFF